MENDRDKADRLEMVDLPEIESVLDEHVRPLLTAHGGDLKVERVEGGIVYFQLLGRCAGCAAADQTNRELIRKELVERVPGVRGVVMVNGISEEVLEQTLEILRMHPSF